MLPLDVHIVTTLLVPVRDHGSPVAECLTEPLLNLARARALGHGREDRADPGGTGDGRAEEACEEEERNRRERRDQRDHHHGVRRAREGGEDETDREEQHAEAAREVHGTKHPAEGRSRLAPAADQEHERGREEEHRDRGPRHRRRDVRGMIVRNEDQVVRTGVRLAGMACGEQRVREGREEGCRVTRDHQDAGRAAEQLPARIGQEQMQKGRDEQAAEQRSQRVRDRVVGLAEAADQDAEPDRDHQHSRPVSRPARPADQPGEDERPADEEPKRNGESGVLLVIARNREREAQCTGQKRRRPEVEPRAAGQAHWAFFAQ